MKDEMMMDDHMMEPMKPAAEPAAPAMSETAMSHTADSPPKYLGKFSKVTPFSIFISYRNVANSMSRLVFFET